MTDNPHKGYRSPSLDVLKKFNVRVWSDVDLSTDEETSR
jgi:hypothetical protein